MAHRKVLQGQNISHVRRWDEDDYPYRSHGQPMTAYAAFTGCFVVLIVINGVSLWKGFHDLPFLSSYVIVSSSPLDISF
jgi:amino acid transporter